MKKTLTGAALALAMGASGALAADEVRLQLQWVTQAQFAGYYVALENGYYEEEDLDVTVLPGGPDIAPPQVLAGGGADAMLNWMPSALAAREKGLPVVNIAQPFKSSGMMLTCWKDAGIAAPSDLADRTLGVWFFGNEFPFMSWMSKLGIETDGFDAEAMKLLSSHSWPGNVRELENVVERSMVLSESDTIGVDVAVPRTRCCRRSRRLHGSYSIERLFDSQVEWAEIGGISPGRPCRRRGHHARPRDKTRIHVAKFGRSAYSESRLKTSLVAVAQFGRAPRCGRGGRGFKSRQPPYVTEDSPAPAGTLRWHN